MLFYDQKRSKKISAFEDQACRQKKLETFQKASIRKTFLLNSQPNFLKTFFSTYICSATFCHLDACTFERANGGEFALTGIDWSILLDFQKAHQALPSGTKIENKEILNSKKLPFKFLNLPFELRGRRESYRRWYDSQSLFAKVHSSWVSSTRSTSIGTLSSSSTKLQANYQKTEF